MIRLHAQHAPTQNIRQDDSHASAIETQHTPGLPVELTIYLQARDHEGGALHEPARDGLLEVQLGPKRIHLGDAPHHLPTYQTPVVPFVVWRAEGTPSHIRACRRVEARLVRAKIPVMRLALLTVLRQHLDPRGGLLLRRESAPRTRGRLCNRLERRGGLAVVEAEEVRHVLANVPNAERPSRPTLLLPLPPPHGIRSRHPPG
mmetsp:Transcript_62193/g.178928  ORF Transcript_62193/g.178928 Transcript_62193/m.178928 type:complete len:203 (-) Transcript_62193:308-916(-)